MSRAVGGACSEKHRQPARVLLQIAGVVGVEDRVVAKIQTHRQTLLEGQQQSASYLGGQEMNAVHDGTDRPSCAPWPRPRPWRRTGSWARPATGTGWRWPRSERRRPARPPSRPRRPRAPGGGPATPRGERAPGPRRPAGRRRTRGPRRLAPAGGGEHRPHEALPERGRPGRGGIHQLGQDLVADNPAVGAIGQHHPEPVVAGRAIHRGEGLAPLGHVDRPVGEPRAGAHVGGLGQHPQHHLLGGRRRPRARSATRAAGGSRARNGPGPPAARLGHRASTQARTRALSGPSGWISGNAAGRRGSPRSAW